MPVLVDVSGHDEVHRHADERAIGERYHEHALDPQDLHQSEDPGGVARQDVSEFLQAGWRKWLVYVI